MKVLAIFLCGAAAFARGQAPRPDQPLTWARIGRQGPIQREPLTVSGILVDASCDDRSALTLRQPPELAPAPQPRQSPGGVSAAGVTVGAKTLERERSDVMAHQVPDLRMRQPDPTCAITGGTFAYALLTDNGQLLNLNGGGNTLAAQFLHASADGRALLNGYGPAVKPRVVIQGRIRRVRLIVEKIFQPGGPT
jgi:hypothetical protein